MSFVRQQSRLITPFPPAYEGSAQAAEMLGKVTEGKELVAKSDRREAASPRPAPV